MFKMSFNQILKKKQKSPFYFLELGAGTGKFSYYIIKYLVETWKTLGMQDIKFTYIMSDISDKNKEYWLDHESLKPYFYIRIFRLCDCRYRKSR